MPVRSQKATQQQTKTHNSRLVLTTIYDQGPISRAEVARRTHLTRTTVSDLVAELLEQGLVEAVGQGPSGGGRSPILLNVVADARHVVSLDLANDAFCGAVVNLRGAVVQAVSLPSHSGAAALERVYTLLDRLLARRTAPILGISIGTPGLVDTAQGVVVEAVNLDWHALPLGRLLQERYNLPVTLANDSQLTALARYTTDSRPGDNLVVIKVGHGVGAGIILNGQVVQGDGFGAGEIGHLVVVDAGEPCRCGNAGCLETVVSADGLRRRAQALDLPAAGPDQVTATPAALVAGVAQAAAAGHGPARHLIAETGRYLGMAAAILVGTLNVRRIEVLGPVAGWGAPLHAAMHREMLRGALPALAQHTHLALTEGPDDTVIQGAATLLLSNSLGLPRGAYRATEEGAP